MERFGVYIYLLLNIERLDFGMLIKDVSEEYYEGVEGNERWDWEHIKERRGEQAMA